LEEIIIEDLEEINKAGSSRSDGDSEEDDSDESDASGTSAMGTAERTDGGTTSGEAPTIVPVKDGKDVQHLSEASPIEWIDILENADNAQAFGLREPAEITGRVKCADKTW
jgi:hypothetical protein